MKKIVSVMGLAAVLVLGIWAGQAVAGACGCNPIPAAGVYGTAEPLTLTHENGSGDNCPTQIRITAKRHKAPDMMAVLVCQPEKNIWHGVEHTKLGNFQYQIAPAEPPIDMSTGVSIDRLEASLRMTDGINLKIMLPMSLAMIGKPNRTVTLRLAGQGKVAPCMCTKIREELAFVRQMHAAYKEPSLIAQARSGNMRGNNPGRDFWMDDKHQLHRFPANAPGAGNAAAGSSQAPVQTYNDLVFTSVNPPEPGKTATSQAAGVAGNYQPDEVQEGAFAQTHPKSCKITMPSHDRIARECIPGVVLKAAYAHEDSHRQLCRKYNTPPTYNSPAGKQINWKTGGSFAGIFIDGRRAPISGYDAWSQNPQNTSADEAAAYAVEVEMLTGWLAAHCN